MSARATRRVPAPAPDLDADPFGERSNRLLRERMQLLGCHVSFETNSPELLGLVRSAFAGTPRHRLTDVAPKLKVVLLLSGQARDHKPSEPPRLAMASAADVLSAATAGSSCVTISPATGMAFVVVSPSMLRFPYHTRYELIEFALFALVARVQRLVPLHAACVGLNGRGVLLMGESGSGKSTVSLLSLLAGLEFVAEDSLFMEPATLRATAVSNFLHVQAESLRWVASAREAASIRKASVITRRSGVRKFEVDLRQRRYKLAARPLSIRSLVFLSASPGEPSLRALSRAEMLARLTALQAYAAGQPGWKQLCAALGRVQSFELRRGQHPSESVNTLRRLLCESH